MEVDSLLSAIPTCWLNRPQALDPNHYRRYIYHSTSKTFWIVLISTLLLVGMVVTIWPAYYHPTLPRNYLQNRGLIFYQLLVIPLELLQAVLILTYLSSVVQISLLPSSFYENFERPLPLLALQALHFIGRLVLQFFLRFCHQLLLW